jgi:hypothetical protein
MATYQRRVNIPQDNAQELIDFIFELNRERNLACSLKWDTNATARCRHSWHDQCASPWARSVTVQDVDPALEAELDQLIRRLQYHPGTFLVQ